MTSLGTTNTLTSVNINNLQITNSTDEKLISTKLNSKLFFENHISSLNLSHVKARKKLRSITRISNYMNLPKRKALIKTFVIS